ncbi:MAG TPA: radical SAM protein, partial [Nitrososphaerales archaeon]|nr:radical SAM protein [Nitrososphaerales archaeon]
MDSELLRDESKIQVREIRCSSLLHEMNFGSTTEYTVNQYRGCTHGCNYCYAPSLIHDDRSWGSYVDVKINAHHVLDRELDRARKMVVFVSSASDPYQPVEARYKITQKVLKVFAKHQFPVLLLTRSPLVLRDLDILHSFDWIRVGFSISSVSTRFYEPGVPSLEKRIEALAKLHDHGIGTFVSMAPIIPALILNDLDQLFDRLKGAGLSTISFGLLRFNGYEKSRQMFEERSGKNLSEVMAAGQSVYQEVKAKAMSHGLDTTGSIFSWDPGNSLDE